MARQDRRQRLFEDREQEILAATLALCSSPDWESVTVEQIAERAEIGKGTLYKHFTSKDELLFRLMMGFYRGLLRALREDTGDGSPAKRLRNTATWSSWRLNCPDRMPASMMGPPHA